MASIFKNKFLSVAGQKERLTNAVKTIGSAFTPGGSKPVLAIEPKSKVGKVIGKGVEIAAQHPYAAIGVVGTTKMLATASGRAAIKSAAGGVKNFLKSGTKAGAELAGKPVVQTTAAMLAADKLKNSSNQAGQPPGVVIVPGSPDNPGQFPQSNDAGVIGGTPGSQNNGAGQSGSTDTVIRNVRAENVITKIIDRPMNDLVGQPLIKDQYTGDRSYFTNLGTKNRIGMPSTARKKGSKHRKSSIKIRKSSRHKGHKRKHKMHRTSRRRRGRFGTEKQFKRRGGLKVHYTKNKQPYVILKSGKARFIKKSKR